ncbi:MerR family transcriptional regulator [Streptacidiphilus cavernicola]|uniref:MerR family transcriptional regulator n=1 Tax=Streptacidiphilus cavernicola TaxID=3342716 RepID=A0ABV6VW42_9ACTN
MFTIGDFARHGRVSVRMLRHYDAIGLLRPAQVDRASGYRLYRAAQLARLNRIVALKGLGFTLQQVRTILDEDVGAEQLRGMLRLRRAELEAAMAEAASGLLQVEARLRSIESEGRMPLDDVIVRPLPAVRLAELSGTATSFDPGRIGPLIDALSAELRLRLADAGVTPTGPRTVWFETPGEEEDEDQDGFGIAVHVGFPVPAGDGGGGSSDGFQVVTLPAVERAAVIVHHGLAHSFLSTSQLMVRWVEAHGYRFVGHAREITLDESDGPESWVAELQAPIVAS